MSLHCSAVSLHIPGRPSRPGRSPELWHLGGPANGEPLRPAAALGLFFLLALGAPGLGAFAGSFVANLGGPLGGQSLTLANYREVFSGSIAYSHSIAEGASGTSGPVLLSTMLAAITATITVVVGLAVARLLSARRPGRFTRAGDLLIPGSIALPGIVLGAWPLRSRLPS